MDFSQAVRSCLNKYVTFKGRACRSEYWFWVLFSFTGSLVASFIDFFVLGFDGLSGQQGPCVALFSIVIFLPGLAVLVRRLHDTNHSGWWVLIGLIPLIGAIILLIWTLQKGTLGVNKFGNNPLIYLEIE